MISPHDAIRAHLLAPLGDLTWTRPTVQLGRLAKTEWSAEFEKFMRNRLMLGALRYGRLADPIGHDRAIPLAFERLERYRATGNLEALVDAANLCLVEFCHPTHTYTHFKAIDR